MNALRRLAFPLRLAAVRISHRPGRTALLAAGIAAGAAVLALVLGGSLVAQDEQTARALERVPPGQRAVTAVYSDLGVTRKGATLATTEPIVRRALRGVTPEEPVQVVQYKLLRIDGGLINLAAMDGVGRWVRLSSGRFPHECTPARCEVVQIGGQAEIPSAPGLRFVKVGEGVLRSPVPFAQLPGESGARIGESFRPEQEPPFVLAAGFDALAGLPALSGFYRTYAWVVPLDPGQIHPWAVDDFLASVSRARATLKSESLFLDVAAPTEQLAAARSSGEVAGRRLLLIGGQAAALLLAFALLAATSMRRDAEAAWQRLTWRGAGRWQLLVMSGVEAGAAALIGAVCGWLLGAGLTALVADRASSPVGAILGHSIFGLSGIGAALLLALAATAVVLLGLRAPALPVGGSSISTVDVAALGALLVVLVAIARGQADATSLSSSATGTFLLLLPGLVTFVIAVASARLLAPALRGLERATRRSAVSVRLASLSLARSPGHAAVAVTFLVASVGLGLFALVYRGTLEQGNEDKAAYEVPLDFVVREDLSPSRLVPPLDAAPLERYKALAANAEVVPVIRQTGSVGAFGGQNRFTLVGLPSAEGLDLRGWRDDFADQPLSDLLAAVEPQSGAALDGPRIPAEAGALILPASVVGGDVSVQADVLTAGERFLHLDLGVTRGRRQVDLRAALPADARGGRVVSLAIGRALAVEEHASEFTRVDGILRLGPLAVTTPAGREAIVEDYAGWKGVNGATPVGDSAVRYLVNEAAERRFQPPQPTDDEAVPVIASPGLASAAGAGGVLPLRVTGGVLRARVVAVARHFPTLQGDFVVADRGLAFTAMNASKPGTARTNEIWIGAPDAVVADEVAAGLRRPPFDVLAVSSRRAVEAELAGDPLSRGALVILGGAALGSVLLALLGLWLLLATDVRDERGELFDLEAQGAGPSLLRRHLRLRGGLVAALGLAGGIGASVALAALVVAIVTVTANATEGEPPLVLHLNLPMLLAICTAYAAGAAALIWGATRRVAR